MTKQLFSWLLQDCPFFFSPSRPLTSSSQGKINYRPVNENVSVICRKDSLLLCAFRIDNCQGDLWSPWLTRTQLALSRLLRGYCYKALCQHNFPAFFVLKKSHSCDISHLYIGPYTLLEKEEKNLWNYNDLYLIYLLEFEHLYNKGKLWLDPH